MENTLFSAIRLALRRIWKARDLSAALAWQADVQPPRPTRELPPRQQFSSVSHDINRPFARATRPAHANAERAFDHFDHIAFPGASPLNNATFSTEDPHEGRSETVDPQHDAYPEYKAATNVRHGEPSAPPLWRPLEALFEQRHVDTTWKEPGAIESAPPIWRDAHGVRLTEAVALTDTPPLTDGQICWESAPPIWRTTALHAHTDVIVESFAVYLQQPSESDEDTPDRLDTLAPVSAVPIWRSWIGGAMLEANAPSISSDPAPEGADTEENAHLPIWRSAYQQ